jgi:outer membrane protein assembly factor BamB
VRSGGEPGQGWILTGSQPLESKPLARPRSVLVGQTVVTVDPDSQVTGRDAHTGQVLWIWTAPVQVQLAAGGVDRVFVLLANRTLAGLDIRTGTDLTRSGIDFSTEPESLYAIGNVYAVDRFVVFERVNPLVPVDASDDVFYFTYRPVLVAVG